MESDQRPSVRQGVVQRGAFWPWSVKAAILVIPAILVVLVTLLVAARAASEWPDSRYDGWILLAIVLFSVLPLALLLIQAIVSVGGNLQAFGFSVSFAGASEKAARALRTTTLAENLGTTDDELVANSSLRSILRALRAARRAP